MRTIGILILALLFACNFAIAQDTMYVYKAGAVMSKQAVADIDSVIFYQAVTAPLGDTVSDIDGNVYHSVTIGTQTWMVENLKTTRYRNGESIPNVEYYTNWLLTRAGAYCNYNNEEFNATRFGRMYNWYAVDDTRNIAPVGWHVATNSEWTILSEYLIDNGYGYEGSGYDIGKSMAAISGWTSSSIAGTPGNDQANNNSSGFTGLPGGTRSDWDGSYQGRGDGTIWWTSTEVPGSVFYRSLSFSNGGLGGDSLGKGNGFYVRCIKDN